MAPSRQTLVAGSFVVGIVAAFLSVGRLWLANHDAPLDVLWAEDGVFPLCIEKVGFLSCLVDPFAGYLLLAPRLLAGVVALAPVPDWALATNVLAALVAGMCCAFVFAWLRRFGVGVTAAALVALLPVLAPISGLEAINALGSIYMLLLFLSAVVVAFQRQGSAVGPIGTWSIAVLLLVTGLTIPLAVLLIPVVLVQWRRRRLAGSQALLWATVLAVTVIVQFIVAQGAAKPRAVTLTSDSISSYFVFLPRSLLTYWPGASISSFDYDVNFTITPLSFTGWIVALLLLVWALALLARRTDRAVAAGLIVLLGIGFGLVPTAIGWANNRYFVTPVWLWGAALVVMIEPAVQRWVSGRWPRRAVVGLAGLLVLVIWWPLIPASGFRSTPAPAWRGEVDRVVAHCISDPALMERPIFSPFWPPDWGDALSEPTHPNLPCVIGFRWR